MRGGRVETVNSTAVGEGRRMRRYGVVVSICSGLPVDQVWEVDQLIRFEVGVWS